MRFARWSFGVAAAYGLVATIGLYFQGPLTMLSLWLYAFAGAAAATQLLYVAIAIDPARFWPVIPVGIASKLSFAIPVLSYSAGSDLDRRLFIAGLIDLALAALFALNWWRLRALLR
ncbi:MAG: hypothetical protein V4659_09295 [Pseudomonadota bacterium]